VNRWTHQLFRHVVSHPIAVGMIFLAVLVFGLVSYQRIPVELMPDIGYPTVTVRTTYDGAAPQEVESQITRNIEASLATIDGLVSLESQSRAGVSDVILGFDWGSDMAAAVQSMRENLQSSFMLPNDADRPLILRYDPTLEPILRLAVSLEEEHPLSNTAEGLLNLREIVEGRFKRELEGYPGVAAVRVRGGLEREISVQVREDWLVARKVSLEQVRASLGQENINIAGGSVLEGDVEYLVRTLNEFSGVDDLRNLKIRRGDGVFVPITDVAILQEVPKEQVVVSRINGGDAIEVEVFKEAGGNVVQVARPIKEKLSGELDDLLGPEVAVILIEDQAAFIESSIQNLRNTAVFGGLLAILVLFLFLRDFRSTLIIGLSIPASVICVFVPFSMLGVTLNMMSLGGLALGIGMLVDNAIVVLENIHRYREEGHPPQEAAIQGVSEVAGAVTASTLTTVAVFFPISFVLGVAGELFGDLSIAVMAALSASLLVALFLVPTLAAIDWGFGEAKAEVGLNKTISDYYLGTSAEQGRFQFVKQAFRGAFGRPVEALKQSWSWCKARWWRLVFFPYFLMRFLGQLGVEVSVASGAMVVLPITRGIVRLWRWGWRPVSAGLLWAAGRFQQLFGRFQGAYETRLPGLLSRPSNLLFAALVLFLGSVWWVSRMGAELLPEMHQGRVVVELAMPVGTPLGRTQQVAELASERFRQHPAVDVLFAQIGSDPRLDTGVGQGDHTVQFRIALHEEYHGSEGEDRVMEALRDSLEGLPFAEAHLTKPSLFSYRTPLEVIIYGYDLEELREVGLLAVERLSAESSLRDVRSNMVTGYPEVQIVYDRSKLHRLGLDPGTVAGRVRDKIQGVVATKIRRGDQRVDVRVQLVEPDRGSLGELKNINVNPELSPVIPLDAVADFIDSFGPSEIRRVDQQRSVVVSANLNGFDLRGAGNKIQEALSEMVIGEELSTELSGQFTEMNKSMKSLQMALLLAVFLVYVIMASTFENLLHPFVILFSVPLALVGSVLGLVLSGTPLSVVVLIGWIVLAGLVVNNAIVLIDAVNRRRGEGLDRLEAVKSAVKLRFRPILITTVTTVLGLLPLSLGLGSGSEIQQPLAIAVIGGLLSSTLLTLGVVPAVYLLVTGGFRRSP
jgi:hydrophobic/amphiphilic exporter-1 (mainly G- bacteria), HAE1 family